MTYEGKKYGDIFSGFCLYLLFRTTYIGFNRVGGLGIGAAIGKYHWWFLGGGILLLTISWRYYFREKKSCELKACQMENRRLTHIILVVATLVVLFFIGLNLYTYLGKPKDINITSPVGDVETIIIPVEGMSCFTCEIAVTSALKKIDGVVSASASVSEKSAKVIYEPDKTDITQLIGAINKTGYKASMPR